MGKILLALLLLPVLFITATKQTYAKLTTAPLQDVQKAVLDYGYNGEFCEVNSPDVTADKLLTIFFGITPDKYYSSLYEKSNCSDKTREFLIGNVFLNYLGGYSYKESFFIIDNKMYRAGTKTFSYYSDKTKGGIYNSPGQSPTLGIETIGSNYFFESEYNKDATTGARLEKSGYVDHYGEDGKQDWTLLAYNGKIYKLTKKIKEDKDKILLDNTPEISPTPTLDASSSANSNLKDWKTYSGEDFSLKYPAEWFETSNQIYDSSTEYEGGNGGNETLHKTQLYINEIQSDLVLANYLSKYYGNQNGFKSADVSVGAYPAKEFYNPIGEGTSGWYIALTNGKKIVLFGPRDSELTKDPLLLQILSTFKFATYGAVLPTDISNWITYKNNNIGFNFLYPPFLDTIYKGDDAGKDTTAFAENGGFPELTLNILIGEAAINYKTELDKKIKDQGFDNFKLSNIHQVKGKNLTFNMYYVAWRGGKDENGYPKMPPVGGYLYFLEAYGFNDGKLYDIMYSRIANNGEPEPISQSIEDAGKYLEKILSTFEIIK